MLLFTFVLPKPSLSDSAAVFSTAIALAALIYTYYQSGVTKYGVKRDYRNAILAWFSDTTKLLIELRLLLSDNVNNYNDKKITLLANLSAQIEIGRLYFPNIDKGDGHGLEKPKAYQGYRNLTLVFLVYSYDIFTRPDAREYIEHLLRLQKEYTSIICEILDPKDFLKETKKHSNKFFDPRISIVEFLNKDPHKSDLFPTRHKS